MEENRHIKEGAFLISLYFIIMLLGIFIPSFLIITVFIMPIPFLIYSSRYNLQQSLTIVAITSLIILVLTVLLANLMVPPLFVLSVIGGMAIGTGIYLQKTAYEIWVRGIIAFVFGLVFVFLFTQFALDINWAQEIDLVVEDSLMMSKEFIEQFGATDQIEEQLDMVEDEMGSFTDLIPTGIALIAMGMAFLTQWIGFRILSQLTGRQMRFPPVRRLQFPIYVVWIYIIALLVTLFESDTSSVIHMGAQNIVTLTGFLMILQGFSFLFFYANHKNRSNILPVLAIIISVLLPFFLIIVRILGIIDIGFPLRAQMQENSGDKKG